MAVLLIIIMAIVCAVFITYLSLLGINTNNETPNPEELLDVDNLLTEFVDAK